jgi:hypothetical protein
MNETLRLVVGLIESGNLRVSAHGYDEMAADGILAREVLDGVRTAVVVEDYPTYAKGPCVLVRQVDHSGRPIHAVWGIPKGETAPAALVTAYRPDPARWADDFLRRRS